MKEIEMVVLNFVSKIFHMLSILYYKLIDDQG